MTIEVLPIKGCPAHPTPIELVTSTADEMDIPYRIHIVTVESHEDANDLRFIGSPTVRLDGADIDPGAGQHKLYGVT